MNAGAVVMLIIGMVGLWGGLIVFVLNYFRASRQEARTGAAGTDERDPDRS